MSHAFLNKNIEHTKNNKIYKNLFFIIKLIMIFVILKYILYNFFIEYNKFNNNHISSISEFRIIGKHLFTNNDYLKNKLITLITANNFITLDTNMISKKLQNIPWIKKIIIKKIWPNTLNIKLIEYKPYARWNNDFFLNQNGDVFYLPKNIDLNFISLRLFGPKNSQHKILNMYNFIKKKFSIHNITIKSIKMNTRESWELILSNSIKLNLGKYNLNERLERFINLYPFFYQLNHKNIKYIDLRYNNGFAIKY